MYKLIIVDDNRSVLNYISKITDFEKFGFSVAGLFKSSEKAIDYMRHNEVDAVITDIEMPETDGTELAKICHDELPNIKVVFLSAFREFEYARSAVRNEVFDYLTKPVDIDEINDLLIRLKKALDKKQASFFSSENMFYAKQNAFFNIADNKLKGDEIIEAFEECGIYITNEKPYLARLRFYIPNFESYIFGSWKHIFKKFYVALNNFLPADSDNVYFLITKTIYDYFEVLVICNEAEGDFERLTEDFKTQFSENVRSFLDLEIKCSSVELIADLNGIYENGSVVKVEKKAQNEVIRNTLAYIDEHLGDEDISLGKIAGRFFVSSNYLSILFKREMNMNFIDYLTELRMKKAVVYLMKTDKSIEKICCEVGYRNKSHFYKVFKSYFGSTPQEYRNNRKRDN